MWWWLVWTVLVLGTLVGAFFLARSLWRKAVALGRELSAASAALGAAGEGIAVAVERAQAEAVDIAPTMFDDVTTLRERVAVRRRARARRAAVRHERHLVTARTWSLEAWLAGRQAQQASARAARAVRDAPGTAAAPPVAGGVSGAPSAGPHGALHRSFTRTP
ncbi:hypothetical protein DNL40_10685 [Xylanimonas oleitrophica]|uniref:Uncharacterized protein n=1 Tax=Xylanimonas oleitrophica TaxID=2607479 RepID=A0A2W5XSI8_9MICO|nr:hypothetical protein [Xylanimonas oleitrophica]PZR52818.1 hypothetical protein DNL40_10685 [Xylanimonas oleitrophica]